MSERITETFHLDQHGNLVQLTEDVEWAPEPVHFRGVTSSVYNRHGNVVEQLYEANAAGADPYLRRVLTTTVRDGHDNPIEQVTSWDTGADGTIDDSDRITSTYSNRKKPAQQHSDRLHELRKLEYDNRGYVTGIVVERDNPEDGIIDLQAVISRTYNSHGVIVENRESTHESVGESRTTLRTIETDRSGNPTRQIYEYARWDGLFGRASLTTTYDNRHRPVRRIEDWDWSSDGTIDMRGDVSFEYRGSVRTAGPWAWRDLLSTVVVYESAVTVDRLQAERGGWTPGLVERLRRGDVSGANQSRRLPDKGL